MIVIDDDHVVPGPSRSKRKPSRAELVDLVDSEDADWQPSPPKPKRSKKQPALAYDDEFEDQAVR